MQKNKPRPLVLLLKILLLFTLVLSLLPTALWLIHYLVGGLFYNGWDGSFWKRVEQLNANNYSKIALMDITPPPLNPNHVSIGARGPYLLFLKINRGEDPQAQDPRPEGDREQVEFTIRQGYGVIKPFLEKRGFWDSFALFHQYTFSADDHGQVLAVFYPSAFSRTFFGNFITKSIGREIIITAKVLNNPNITNEVTYEWTPVDLHPEDFDQAVNAFVGWHNQTRLIDRTEVGTEVPSYVDEDTNRFDQALGITPPPPPPVIMNIVQEGMATSNGQDVPNGEYSYHFFWHTGREPWGYMGKNVVFISREFTNSVDFWIYDPATGLMIDKVRYPAPSGLGAQEDQSEYQQINGNYFHAGELSLSYYGQVNTYRWEMKTAVTLAP